MLKRFVQMMHLATCTMGIGVARISTAMNYLASRAFADSLVTETGRIWNVMYFEWINVQVELSFGLQLLGND